MAIFATVVYIGFCLVGGIFGLIVLAQNDWEPVRMKDARPIFGNLMTIVIIALLYLWVLTTVKPAAWVVWTMVIGFAMITGNLVRIMFNNGVWHIKLMSLIVNSIYSIVVIVGLLQAVPHA